MLTLQSFIKLEKNLISDPRYLFDHRAATHEVWDFEIHQLYNQPVTFANDIAILMIHDEFQFGPLVQKAKLSNTDAWMKESTVVVVTGWGETQVFLVLRCFML